MNLNFEDELEGFQKALEQKRQALAELEQKRKAHAIQTRKARKALEDLRAVLRGETPPSKQNKKDEVEGIPVVEINEETKRPVHRGDRRKQIRAICRKVGASGEVFRTRDVLHLLRKVEPDVNEGLRSYIYTVMKALEDEGLIEKQEGRGKWILVNPDYS